MPNDPIPPVKHHVALAREVLLTYNNATQILERAWSGERADFPVDEVSFSWWDLVDAGERDADEELVKDIAKEISKRRKQLEVSRNTDQSTWSSPSVRDFGHSTAENALSRAATHLESARDASR